MLSKIKKLLNRTVPVLVIFYMFLLFQLVSCDLPHQPGPQPSQIVDLDFKAGHNIIGVLRLDDQPASSFVYVERAYKTEETDNNFVPLIDDAHVVLKSDSLSFIFSFVADSLRGNLYQNPDFRAQPGTTYTLTVSSPGLPDLRAGTTVPEQPRIIDQSLSVTADRIQFSIRTSADIETYDIFLISASDRRNLRLPNDDSVLQVSFNPAHLNGDPQRIEVYGYESNLSSYLSSAVTIKPQAYHQTVTTVNGGYGCFGALSKTVIPLNNN